MTYEDIFFYAKKYYKIFFVGILVFLLLITTLLAKNNEEVVEKPVLIEPEEEEGEKETEESQSIYVDLKGEVTVPGVYQMTLDDRIIDVVNLAGGFTSEANTMTTNLSQKLRDEMVIIIPNVEDEDVDEIVKEESEDDDLVCIQTAGAAELATLPGIGATRAQDIINYRENNPFTEIKDIMDVSGIGEATYAQIEDLVTIR